MARCYPPPPPVFETFGWVPPMTKGWGETSGCATLWGCSMVHRGKNIVNGSKKSPISPCNVRAVRAPCPCCAHAVHKRPLGLRIVNGL